MFIANLDTAARLEICKPPKSINRNESRQHPIHYAAFDGKYRKWISDSFRRAFGIEVTPNVQYGATIPLSHSFEILRKSKFQKRRRARVDTKNSYQYASAVLSRCIPIAAEMDL